MLPLFLLCLTELKEVGETGHGEDLVDVGIHARDEDTAASCLGRFQYVEENTQSAGRDILQLAAIEDDVLVLTIVEWLKLLLGLGRDRGVETPFQDGDKFTILLFDGGFHNLCYYSMFFVRVRMFWLLV